ncbi:MAG: AAA family ATPase [bacterium]|nr:AAA family ATPase [bacterium]
MIIGITGTNGSGKGTVVGYLVTKGFKHYSARAFIVAEIQRRGLSVDRTSMREVANDLRKTQRPTIIAEALYEQAMASGGNAVIESIREIASAEFLKKHGGVLIAVDADRNIRYERIVARSSETDKVDFDTWVKEEEREWGNASAWDMDVVGVMKLADFTLHNDGTLDELHAQIDEVLKKITK